MEVIDFEKKKADLEQETTATITWLDDGDPVEIDITSFGNSASSPRMLVFYNDNRSEAPIFVANEDAVRYIELTPLGEPIDEEAQAEFAEPTH